MAQYSPSLLSPGLTGPYLLPHMAVNLNIGLGRRQLGPIYAEIFFRPVGDEIFHISRIQALRLEYMVQVKDALSKDVCKGDPVP